MKLFWTFQPYSTIWDQLLFFRSIENVKKLLLGKMGSERSITFPNSEIVEKKASQIAYSIAQAYEYFVAADSVSLTTSPLLYFYGMLSLAKALILANDPSKLLSDIPYHGLTTKSTSIDLKNYIKNENLWNIEDEFAVIRSGVFDSLIKVTMDFRFPNETIVNIKELLKLDPELIESYSSFYQEQPNVKYLYDIKESQNPYKLTICPLTLDSESFENIFPEFSFDFVLDNDTRGGQALVYQSREHITCFPNYLGVYKPMAGGKYLIGGISYSKDDIKIKKYIFPEISDYLLMFILSNCVRYKQEFWGMLINGNKNGSIGLLNVAISNIKTRYIGFILNHLYNDKFEYGVVSRWM
jgi:hypothetical protein